MTPVELTLAVALVVLTGVLAVLLAALRRAQISRRWALAARASAVESQQRIAELAVAAERLRILREMHDVIAHSLAIMIAQADGGSYVSTDAEAARRAFTTIAETGRGALADTRRILGILKHNDDDAPELTPTPDTGLDALAAKYRDAGLAVSLIRVGEARGLPAGTRTAMHRITQEALTNVLKHAGARAAVIVTENWRAEAVTLTVTSSGGTRAKATDPVTGESLPGVGLGLIGMRERAQLLGGTLAAGPTETGFQVRAELPFRLEEET
jgi:signal transduction histidine kinase